MRAVQGDLPGESDQPHAAARFPRRHRAARVLKEEEPFHCIRCGKPFGVKSTIERVTAKLEGKHWMFKGSAKRLDVIKMCEDCRVTAVTRRGFRSLRHAAPGAAHHARIICASAKG